MTSAPARRGARVRVAIALGSNLGARDRHLQWAIERLRDVLTEVRASAPEDTAPVDVPDSQPRYLNCVVVGHTTLSPRALLETLLGLEHARGRVRTGVRSARTLDLDLVLYGNVVIAEPDLVVPHPRFRERPFVLGPLASLAPRWRDPVSGLALAALWRTHRRPGRS